MAEKICTAPEVSSEGNGKSPENKAVEISESGRVLASGFDSLVLSLSVLWKDEKFFKNLRQLKADAAINESPLPGSIKAGADTWVFNVLAHGSEGYAFLLESSDYFLKIIDSMLPKARPSVMIEIRSVTLWQMGVIEAVDRILTLLANQGATIVKARASRVDPCLDILLPESLWTPALEEHIVKQADYFCAHKDGRVLAGMSIGRGDIQARLYDKPYEIQTKSKKYWMYDIWELKEVPAGGRIIRVEFQLRREVLVQLGIDTVWQLVNHPRNLWAYCVKSWLKFQENARLHHTQQWPMPWWKTVQEGFLGGQRAHPLIRAKVINCNKVQISHQLFGQLTSFMAAGSKGNIKKGGQISAKKYLAKVKESALLIGMSSTECYEKVRRKIAKHFKGVENFKEAEEMRKALGFPLMGKKDIQKGGAK